MQYVETEDRCGTTVINLYGKISTYVFYNFFMKEIYDYTNKSDLKKKPPIISIRSVNWIDSNVLPCLIAVGIILKKYYKVPLILEMVYNPSLLQYLDIAEFFLWIGEERLNIYNYDKELIGGFNLFVKEYNKQYKIERFQSRPGYYELDDYEKKLVKYSLLEQLERYDIRRIFGELLSKVMLKNSQEYDRCIQAISEIVCNSMLYSESDAYICIQALTKGVYISISDLGIGFEQSLYKRGLELDKSNEFIHNKKYLILKSDILNDFFAIFTALRYAEETERINLWRLKKIVTDNKGIMRIHSNRIQIVFSYNRCYRCKYNSVSECMNCMMQNFSTNYKISPLRIYDAKIEGVHIEIDFKRED